MPLGKSQGIGRLKRAHPLCRAEDIMPKWMSLEDEILKLVVDELSRRVVITLYLIAYYLYLLVYLVLGILAVEDDIRQQMDSLDEMVFCNGSIEHGIFLIGEGIQFTTNLF